MNVPKHAFEITQDGIIYVNNVELLEKSDVGIKTTVTSIPDYVLTELK